MAIDHPAAASPKALLSRAPTRLVRCKLVIFGMDDHPAVREHPMSKSPRLLRILSLRGDAIP
jgi:hypothetical protein